MSDEKALAEKETAEPLPITDETLIPPPILFEPQLAEKKPQLRFAEDIPGAKPVKSTAKTKKRKKKGAYAKESTEDGIKLKKARRGAEISDVEDEDY